MATAAAQAILFLCDYQAPYGGNFIASMRKLDDALSARNVPATYLFPAGAAARDWCVSLQRLGKCVQFLPTGGMRAQLACLLETIDARGITILHVHFGFFPLGELAALLRPRLRLILHFHSDFSAGRAPTWKQRLRAAAKRLPEAIIGKRLQKITVSESSARTTRDCIPLHNALACERFVAKTCGRAETRAALRLEPRDTLVLAFGWSPWIKGVDIVARAVQSLRAAGHSTFVLGVVCGREYPKERMRAFLSERAGCAGDEPWLRFLAPSEDVFAYHAASDIMASASRSETFSYALLEAICSQRPCVASDIPGVRWAKAFDTVAFFPTENADALADALLSLEAARHTPAFAERLRQSSDAAREEFALEDWVRGMLAIYGVA